MFLLWFIWAVVRAVSVKRADLVAENLALRQQLIVLHRRTKRPRLKTKDRVFWLWLAFAHASVARQGCPRAAGSRISGTR